MEYQFRPIEQWPGPKTTVHKRRNRRTFSAPWTSTLRLLECELRHLGARNIVLQAFVVPRQIRQDGMLYADAKPTEPGIILSFDSKHGPLSYPCDSCLDWQHNVRSIALALEALRSVDRYGVTRRAEQYKGWAKLPGPVATEPVFENDVEAGFFIASIVGAFDSDEPRRYVREAKAKTHPDHGGNPDLFKRVCAAAEILGVA